MQSSKSHKHIQIRRLLTQYNERIQQQKRENGNFFFLIIDKWLNTHERWSTYYKMKSHQDSYRHSSDRKNLTFVESIKTQSLKNKSYSLSKHHKKTLCISLKINTFTFLCPFLPIFFTDLYSSLFVPWTLAKAFLTSISFST